MNHHDEPGSSAPTEPTDSQLVELIAAGDWVQETDPPRLSTVMRLVASRRRRRRYTAFAGGAGLACAAAAGLVFAMQPHQADSTGPAPATQSPTSSQQSTAAGPATCTNSNQRISDHGAGTYRGRRAETMYLENIGSSPCTVRDFPKVQLGTRDYHYTLDSSRAIGPWVLGHDEALAITVVAAPTHSCMRGVSGLSDQITLTAGGYAFAFNVPGMHGGGCIKPPTLAPVRVVRVRD
jgi:hypothetical protein